MKKATCLLYIHQWTKIYCCMCVHGRWEAVSFNCSKMIHLNKKSQQISLPSSIQRLMCYLQCLLGHGAPLNHPHPENLENIAYHTRVGMNYFLIKIDWQFYSVHNNCTDWLELHSHTSMRFTSLAEKLEVSHKKALATSSVCWLIIVGGRGDHDMLKVSLLLWLVWYVSTYTNAPGMSAIPKCPESFAAGIADSRAAFIEGLGNFVTSMEVPFFCFSPLAAEHADWLFGRRHEVSWFLNSTFCGWQI